MLLPGMRERLRALIEKSNKNNVGFFILSANTKSQTERYLQKNKLTADYFDGRCYRMCKTAMRTNPGLMLIKAGTVLGKWSYNDYPEDFRSLAAIN